MQKIEEKPWFSIKISLYKERILLEDENKFPAITIFKDNFEKRYIGLTCFGDCDNFYYLIQEVDPRTLVKFLNGNIELKSALKNKNKLYKIDPEDKVELIDSSFVDSLPWKEDSYFLFNINEEEKEYLEKISDRIK